MHCNKVLMLCTMVGSELDQELNIMSYTPSAVEAAFSTTYAPAKTTRKRGFVARLLDTLMAARMRQAERDVARYITETGGKFTDEAEREIERRFLSPSSRL